VLTVSFHGVRGSTPCSCEANRRYGGNTSCVGLEVPGQEPIVLDIGTGLRFFGDGQPQDGTFRGSALVSHLHWDHIQGLPFFTPILKSGATFDVYAPVQEDGLTVAEAFDEFMRHPYFPVTVAALPADIRFIDCHTDTFHVGQATVTAREVPHVGRTLGFRIEWEGATVAYIPDHQQPFDGGFDIAEGVLELADGVDLLIHDAQYTTEEFPLKRTWGHCTVDYALWVAKEAGVKCIALFHHDPGRSDDEIDHELECARHFGAKHDFEVLAAAEGAKVTLGDDASVAAETGTPGADA
jgi:phosphoribosyl 1,2-cyclic phosphodiesterase